MDAEKGAGDKEGGVRGILTILLSAYCRCCIKDLSMVIYSYINI